MKLPWFRTVSLGAVVFLPLLLAQETTGVITGFVRDQSQGLVAGAQVTVQNQNTGLRRVAQTNQEGRYRVPYLPVGVYSVQVDMQGFRSQKQVDVQLEVLQVRTIDFSLQLGAVAEAITVESTAPLLEAETSQAGEVINTDQVTNLPLGRRNFLQLTFLAPMSVPASSDFRSTEIGRGSAMPASAGQRPEQNNYQIDGIDNREAGRNGIAISPPVDSISEFKVVTGMSSAEMGRGGGTIVSVITKSGTNDYHGSLYEFLRNEYFDSRPYFASRKSPLKLNQFGGALGGPIKQNRLFFFGNFEGLRQTSAGSPPLYRVFSEDERRGVFASPIVDPFTKVPFPNNTIPESLKNLISKNLLQLVPAPNRSDPLRNFIFDNQPPARTTGNSAVGRVDYNLGANDNLYGRYLFNQEEYGTSPSLPAPANSGGRSLDLRAQGASTHWNHIVTPALVNSLSLGYTRYHNVIMTLNSFKQDWITPSGITNTLAATDPLFWAAPNLSVTGYTMPSEVTPNYRTTDNYQIQESVSWSRGAHNFKFGGDVREIREWMFYTGGNGSFAFANRYSGNVVADFLLGYPSQVNKTIRASQWNSRVRYLGVFFQDDWKITPRLTLNIGIRYEVESALKQHDDGGVGFDPTTGTVLLSENVANRSIYENFYGSIRNDVPLRFVNHRSPYDADTNNVAPRIGLAYRFLEKTVLRGGFGIFYDAPQIQSLASTNDFTPNTLRPTWTASPSVPDIPYNYNPEGGIAGEITLKTVPLRIAPIASRHFPYGNIRQWMLSLQHQIRSSLVVEATYQGSNARNLLVFDNLNARPPGPGTVQSKLPYPLFTIVQAARVEGQSWYNGAAVKLEQRPWHGLSYLMAYTFSKTLDTASSLNVNATWTDPRDKLGTSKGLAGFDVRNRFTLAFEYALPLGPGKPLFGGVTGAASKLLSGWGARGTVVFQTGFPADPAMNLSRLGTCNSACSARPDRIADGNLDKDTRTLDRFFDVNAFRLLAAGGADARVGTSGRNVLIQPGSKGHDLQVFKNTKFRENHAIEFRWEMYNAWNHANWGAASVNSEVPATFGVISSRGGPRTMQFALKYQF